MRTHRSPLGSLLALTLALALSAAPAPAHAAPRAEAGRLDLRAWDFHRKGPVPLNGEWSFAWKRFLPPSRKPAPAESTWGLMPVPAAWNAHLPGEAGGEGSGFATYRLRILLKDPSGPYSLHIPEISTAYTLFVDGVRRLDVGRPGPSPSESVPRFASAVVPFVPRGPQVELVLWVSNFHHHRGGLWAEMLFGPAAAVHARRLHLAAMDLFLFGAVLAFGLVHLGLYAIRREEHYSLLFGLFCLLMAGRVLVTGERYVHALIPGLPWAWMIRIEYLTFYLGGCTLALLLHSLFPSEFRRGPLKGILLLASPLVLLAAAFSPAVFTQSLSAAQGLTLGAMAYGLYALALAARRRRPGAVVFLAGLLAFSVAAGHDILYARGLIASVYLFHAGLVAMALSLTWVVCRRYGLAFGLIERQQSEIHDANQRLRQELAERKKVEARLARYSEDLEADVEERTRSLQKAQDALIRREKLATLGRLAGGVGHELRNPLGAIRNAVYFLRMALESPSREVREALEILDHETTRSEKTIASLFSLEDPGKPQIHVGIDLHVLLRRVLAGTSVPASVTVDDRLDASLLRLDADPDQLEQVFGNLLRNAVQAMPEGGTLTVRSGKTDDGGVEIEVSDTGSGIPEENLDSVFEPLFTTKAKGIGLGLALCKDHVEAHGGTIRVVSEEGKGTTFTVRLPLKVHRPDGPGEAEGSPND